VKAEKDAPVLVRMAALGAQYPRFGYRRIGIFLDREGHAMSWGRCYRLWRRARLQVPRRRPRKRIATGRPRPQAPSGANQVWSYDFVMRPQIGDLLHHLDQQRQPSSNRPSQL
jgi:putative transposase